MRFLKPFFRLVLTALFIALFVVALLELYWSVAVTAKPEPSEFVQSFLVPTARYFARLFEKLFPWPLVVLVALIYFFNSPTAFAGLLGLMRIFRKVRVLGTEIEVSPETQKQIKAAATDLTVALKEYRDEVKSRIQMHVRRLDLDRKLSRFAEDYLAPKFPNQKLPTNFRCTIHVRDFVLDGTLYQLLNYYPTAVGSGRWYPERYGIIGKVWRSEIPMNVGDLLPGFDPNASDEEKIAKIMQDWGMMHNEAKEALKKPSYACCVIECDHRKWAVFYMDATIHNAFIALGDNRQTSRAIIDGLKQFGVPRDIDALMQDAEKISLGIRVAQPSP